MVLTSGVETLAMGNWPRAMEPERRRFCAVGSIAMEVMPGPGMKVEKRMPSAAWGEFGEEAGGGVGSRMMRGRGRRVVG